MSEFSASISTGVAVYSTIGALFSAFNLIGVLLIWRSRNVEPVKSRRAWLIIIQNLACCALSMSIAAPHATNFQDVSCITFLLPSALFTSMSFIAVFLRMINLWISFVVTRKAIEFWNQNLSGSNSSGKFLSGNRIRMILNDKISAFMFKHRRMLTSDRKLGFLFCTLVALNVLPVMMFFVVSPETAHYPSHSSNCFSALNAVLVYFLSFAMIISLLMIFVAIRIHRVEEGFGIKKELLVLAYCLGFVVLIALIQNYIAPSSISNFSISHFRFNGFAILWLILPFTFACYFSTYKVFWHTKEMDIQCTECRSSELGNSTTSFVNSRKRSSVNPTSVLSSILSNEMARSTFLRFLEKEFSQENLLFLIDVEKLRQGKSINCDDIFNSYIDDSAPLMINIEGHVRKKIVRLFSDETIEKSPALFSDAYESVFQLLRNDSLSRFMRTDEFKDQFKEIFQVGSVIEVSTPCSQDRSVEPMTLSSLHEV